MSNIYLASLRERLELLIDGYEKDLKRIDDMLQTYINLYPNDREVDGYIEQYLQKCHTLTNFKKQYDILFSGGSNV
jgi:hypothetical protein